MTPNRIALSFTLSPTLNATAEATDARTMERKGFRYSYDMLGEAALTAEDAARNYGEYDSAIQALGKAAKGQGPHQIGTAPGGGGWAGVAGGLRVGAGQVPTRLGGCSGALRRTLARSHHDSSTDTQLSEMNAPLLYVPYSSTHARESTGRSLHEEDA